MKHKEATLLLLVLFFAPLVLSWTTVPVKAQVQPIHKVAVSVPSLAGIVKEIGGALVSISILLEQQTDPHAFTVNPAIIAAAEAADLLVFTGHFHWEKDIANQTAKPFISFQDEDAWEQYENFGAGLSPLPGGIEFEGTGGNPHAYWLLPKNAIAIANATRAALSVLNSTLSDSWSSNFDSFTQKMDNLQSLVESLDEIHSYSDMRAIVVSPAEAYVAETFGIPCDAVLQVEDITISGAKLLEVQTALRNGTVELILGSDVSQFKAGGEYAYQLQEDYGGTLIWWQTIFYPESDYFSMMTFNLGALVSGIEGRSGGIVNESVNIGLIALISVLGIIIIIETILLIQRARAE
ncbi:MAG: zinc ABC transporter substrate-binding protein [Candidatus Thorarchaeota archaeon]|nr:zinc ABC transporter substrate-binding protein [Candidatus Thorarchaeota archaeon]